MKGSIRLTDEDRKNLLPVYGLAYRDAWRVVFCGFDLISECVQRFRAGGVAGVLNHDAERVRVPLWLARVAQWLLTRTPGDFGDFRSRWSCQTLAEVLAWEDGREESSETIRRGLERLGFVWRRPARSWIRSIRSSNENGGDPRPNRVPAADETFVFQHEVDVHLNPKIGSAWMVRGHQAEVVMPGNNQKRHVAGSLHWRTGTLLVSPPGRKGNAELFVAHLDDLRQRLRGYRKIHVICDNAAFHGSRLVQQYLYRWRGRIELHFLPTYAPDTNPIERVWWRMHAEITCNHRCQTLDELLNEAYIWCQTQEHFYSRTLALYAQAGA
jgi:transposase